MKTTKTNQFSRIFLIAGIILLSVSTVANASGVIKGQVFDENNRPIQYATATLINPETNEIVEGDMCDNTGEYVLENVKPGNYILSVRNVGYEKSETAKVIVNSSENLMVEEPIVLKEASYQLPEIEVISRSLTGNKLQDAKVNSKS